MVLARSRLYCGCAIPVASHLLVAGSKDEWKPFWLDLLETLRWRVPADRTMLITADRDLYAKWLYEEIQALGVTSLNSLPGLEPALDRPEQQLTYRIKHVLLARNPC